MGILKIQRDNCIGWRKDQRNFSLSLVRSVNAPFGTRWRIAGTDAKFHLKISQQNNVHKSQNESERKS